MLEKEYDHLHDVVKTLFAQFLTWYTFFTGLNLIAYGWFAGQLAAGKGAACWIILIVCLYFGFQHALATIGTNHLVRYFEQAQNRMEVLLGALIIADADSSKPPHHTITVPGVATPFALYIKSLKLFKSTFPSMIVLWIAFTVVAFMYDFSRLASPDGEIHAGMGFC